MNLNTDFTKRHAIYKNDKWVDTEPIRVNESKSNNNNGAMMQPCLTPVHTTRTKKIPQSQTKPIRPAINMRATASVPSWSRSICMITGGCGVPSHMLGANL